MTHLLTCLQYQIVKTLYHLTGKIRSLEPRIDDNTSLLDDELSSDRSVWLVTLSCYVRILQGCRYALASLKATLERDDLRNMLSGLHVEDAMLGDEETDLKVLILLQVLTYRLHALATALHLPEHHRFNNNTDGSSQTGRGTGASSLSRDNEAAANLHAKSCVDAQMAVIEWILQGDAKNETVSGSSSATKGNLTELLKEEMSAVRKIVS